MATKTIEPLIASWRQEMHRRIYQTARSPSANGKQSERGESMRVADRFRRQQAWCSIYETVIVILAVALYAVVLFSL